MKHLSPLRSCLFGLTIIAITFASIAPAQAGGIKFSIVAETSNTPPFFSGFSDFPAINNRGTVAFRASEDFGVFRIYTGPAKGGGPYPDVAETDFTLVVPFDPFINDQGTVAFYAWGTAFSGVTNREILSAPASGSGPVVRIVDNEAGTFSDFSFPGLNSSTIAFLGTFTGGRGLFSVPAGGGALTPVTDTPTGPLATFATPALSSNGVLVFRGRLDTGLTGIFSTSASGSGPITTVADTTEGFSAFGSSIAIANGTAVFQARETSGTTGIYTAPANGTGPVTAIATSAGGFFSDFINGNSFLYGPLAEFAINDDGLVVFFANLTSGGFGIFAGPDPAANRIIASGDPLFGSTVTNLAFSNGSLNNDGQLAFYFELADGRSGIAVASKLKKVLGQ